MTQPQTHNPFAGNDDETLDLLTDVDLDCPSCGENLLGTEQFEIFRVCPSCRRHFAVPARDRLSLLVDPGSFAETNATLVSVDPIVFRDQLPFPEPGADEQDRSGVSEAVITGVATIGGQSAVLVVLDGAYLGGNIGIVAGEKIILAMELAAANRRPLIAICAGGAARTQEGMLSLVQLAKISAAATHLHRDGVPFISILTHPTIGGVFTGLANQADVIFAEPGAHVGQSGAREPTPLGRGATTAETLLEQGMIDEVVDRARLRNVLATLLNLVGERGSARPSGTLDPLSGGSHPAWEALVLARHADRPTALDYIRRLMPEFVELHGDRIDADDPAVICGIGRIDGITVAVVGQERGRGPEHERRRGGRMLPRGYRKAVRLMRLAGHFELPVVTLVDSPGAMAGVEAEAHGIGAALAQTFRIASMLPVPIVSVVIGEGGGAGALALSVGDRILMQERAVYSVVGPEDVAARLYRPGDVGATTPASLRLTARDCQRLGIVDGIIPEPSPAAHTDPDFAARQLRIAILHALADLSGMGPRRLLDARARKLRQLGLTSVEGREAARLELSELQELQRTVTRSLNELRDDLRARWEHRNLTLPNLSRLHLHRPDLGDLANRLAALKASVNPPSIVILRGGERQPPVDEPTADPVAGVNDDAGA